MIFKDILVKNKYLRTAWHAGNSQIPEDLDENTSLPNICKHLDRWVGSDNDPRRRVSLRTSAILIDGAAKLYRNELDNLLKDFAKLDEAIVFRNRTRSENSDGNDTSISSESSDSPEQMMRHAEIHSDTSIEKHIQSQTISLKEPDINLSFSTCSEQNSSTKRQRTETFSYPDDRLTKRRNIDWITDQSITADIASGQSESTDQKSVAEEVFDHSPLNRNNDRSSNRSSSLATAERQKSDPQTSKQSEEISNGRCLSPTFTDLFDFVSSLPNYDIEGTGANIDGTGRETEDRRTTTERVLDETTEESTEERFDNYRKTTESKESDSDGSERNSDGARAMTEGIPDGGTVAERFDDRGESDREGSVILGSFTQKKRKQHRKKKVRFERIPDDGAAAERFDDGGQSDSEGSGSKQGKTKSNRATQTDSFCPSMSERDSSINDLPFGCLLIYKSNSRIPSRVVCSSLSADVNNLV